MELTIIDQLDLEHKASVDSDLTKDMILFFYIMQLMTRKISHCGFHMMPDTCPLNIYFLVNVTVEQTNLSLLIFPCFSTAVDETEKVLWS